MCPVFKCYAMNTQGEVELKTPSSLTRDYMRVSFRFHAAAALATEKELLVFIR
jgi:hypothetical protein